ncbi:MAG: DUF2397 domain-containing protein [Chloroflexota bacterium]|nr:DUF2397 domain-containing protein [Chloroflexota bacterium]
MINSADNPINIYREVIERENGATRADASSEGSSSVSAFNLTGRIQLFSYLVASDRVGWYRTIMRAFLQGHREYRYQLTDHDILDAVRQGFDPEYTLDKCQADLKALKDWGNLTTIYDSSRATSIASFLAPALLYQATPEGIAIETFLDEQARASTRSGALRQGDLPRLWKSLQQIDAWLRLPAVEVTSERSNEIAEEWRSAFEVWNALARDAAQYLATMIKAAQQSGSDLEAYRSHKTAVVTYVQSFAQALSQYSRDIRTLLEDWTASGQKDRLVTMIAEHLEPPTLTSELKRTQAELTREALNQVAALENWFAEGKNAYSFRRNALAEVEKVVRRAIALATAARPNANYAVNLHLLAQQLLWARDVEAAQQLFDIAFANPLPIHLPESFAGLASAAQEAGELDAWHEPPTVLLQLRPVSRSNRGERSLEEPMADHQEEIRALLAQQEGRLQEQRQRFATVFRDAYVDLGTIEHITPEDRALLVEVIDNCLSDPSHQYHAPNGSIVVLLNPDEETYTHLPACDGVLLLQRYRLQLQDQVMAGKNGDSSN